PLLRGRSAPLNCCSSEKRNFCTARLAGSGMQSLADVETRDVYDGKRYRRFQQSEKAFWLSTSFRKLCFKASIQQIVEACIRVGTEYGQAYPQFFQLEENSMSKKTVALDGHKLTANPRYHQRAPELQAFGTVSSRLPLQLGEPVRLEMTEQLNQLLADTMTLRDLYKKSHWQVAGPTFYQLHLLYDKHYEEQSELVDTIAERIQILGGISIAMAADVAETTRIERPPKGREEVPVQLSRLLDAHELIITHCRELADRATQLGDPGTNDLAVSDVLRTNELQVWFLSDHLVEEPLVKADPIEKFA